MTLDTRLAMASGCKAFTALVVLSLAADGTSRWRPVCGNCWATICLGGRPGDGRAPPGPPVGIGDYLDENADHQIDDYVMTVPVHTLADPATT